MLSYIKYIFAGDFLVVQK